MKDLNYLDCIDKNEFIKNINNDSTKYKNNITQVFHLGACSKTTEPDRDYIMSTNLLYSKDLLKYSANNKISLIYASSASVYGEGKDFIEDSKYESCLNHYAESKLLFDNYVRENMTRIKSQIVGMRYFNVYGPYEQHKEVMSSVAYHFYNQFKQYGMLKLFRGSHGYDDGEQRRDFVYVKDTIDVKLWFMQNNYSGIFNVASGKSRSFNDVANSVMNYFNSGYFEYINFPEGLEAQYQAFTEADMSNLRNRGYEREATELEDGVSSYLKFLDEN